MTRSTQATFFYRALLVALLGLQVMFWWKDTRFIKPELDIVPTPPRAGFIRALSMGDPEFMFRTLTFMMQNTGDTFGRFSPLKQYDYDKLFTWFATLDTLNSKSDILPSLAAYYYSQTQNVADVRYVVNYLYDHAMYDLPNQWWWLVQSIYLARHKLKDEELTLKVATPLGREDLPVFARQMLAVVYADTGEMEQAYQLILEISKHADTMSEQDLLYMNYFIDERLKKLDEYQAWRQQNGMRMIRPEQSRLPAWDRFE